MEHQTKSEIIATSWQLHTLVENAYKAHSAVEGDSEWLDKQRILLADMALHLLQTAIYPNDIELDTLRNNLHAILTISDAFLPHADLKSATEKLYLSQD